MDLNEVLRRRRMVRHYDPARPVDDAALQRVLWAATRAPSAGFTQGLDLLVLRTPDDRRRFWISQVGEARYESPSRWLAGMRTAPVLVVVLSHPQAYLDRYAEPDKSTLAGWPVPYWDVDAGMAALLILLAAVDAGLGACFFGLERDGGDDRLREAFAIPASRRCVGIVSLGHPAPDATTTGSAATRPRRDLADLAHEGRFGTPSHLT